MNIFKDKKANTVDLDETAHYEPSHLDLHCLQIQLLFCLALSRLTSNKQNRCCILFIHPIADQSLIEQRQNNANENNKVADQPAHSAV